MRGGARDVLSDLRARHYRPERRLRHPRVQEKRRLRELDREEKPGRDAEPSALAECLASDLVEARAQTRAEKLEQERDDELGHRESGEDEEYKGDAGQHDRGKPRVPSTAVLCGEGPKTGRA